MKKTILAATLAVTAAANAWAAEYYVVVPVKGKTAPAVEIAVTLNAATLPPAMVGQAYTYNLRDHLLVTGDTALDLTKATLSTADPLPAGITLASNGILSGTPTVSNDVGSSFQVIASYKTKTGQQAYTIIVNKAVLQVTQVATGHGHTCAVTPVGGVKCWGNNNQGQLGNNKLGTNSSVPVDVTGLGTGVVSVVLGHDFSCAVTATGGAKCWGRGTSGQLGNGIAANSAVPVNVTGLPAAVASIAAGADHTCAVTTTGAAFCWGSNTYGHLGNSTTTNSLVPVSVTGLSTGVARIVNGQYFTCSVTTSGGAKCWGYNASGQLGDGSLTNRSAPVDVSGLTSGVASIAAEGSGHTCAVTTSGGVKCWGRNASGQLGNNSTTTSTVPVSVSGLSTGVASVVTGSDHSCALTTAGAVMCWGYNGTGSLGNNSTINSKVPVNVVGLSSGVSSIAGGFYHTCAVATGGLKCWGYNYYGQLGDTTTTNRLIPVDVLP